MGSNEVVWELKKEKVMQLAREGKRVDERAFDEYRKIHVDRQISENADGSARVQLGETTVVSGVKFIVGTPYPDSPDEGSISVGLELLPLASPSFEVGPPRDDSIEISRVVDRGIRESKALDFKALCIKEGEQVWVSFIDAYALNDDGNLFDCASYAALASLLEAKMPKLEDGKIVKGEYKGKIKLARKPLLCTFAKVGNVLLVDPNTAEEKAMSARFSVAVTEDDFVSAFQKGGQGSFTSAEIDQCIDIALKRGKEIRKQL